MGTRERMGTGRVRALTYLKARQLGGEGIEEIALRDDEK
jgi:hypothetical protein